MIMLLLRLSLLLGLALGAPAGAALARPLTILVSIDGFRADYLQRGLTPNLAALAKTGVTTIGMRPSFPVQTFPNHYTLVTGLRPDHHGIVDNQMQDPARPDQTFSMGARRIANDRFWWDQATPIWITAERAGIRTATMYWPGSDVDIQGVRPSDWRMFDKAVTAAARTDQVLAWLDRPAATRPRLVTLYFDDVDTEGHGGGPDGAAVDEALSRVDAQIGRLVAGLKARKLAANLVIVADHGMAAISPDRVVYLDDWAPADAIRPLTLGAVSQVFPTPGREGEAAAALAGEHPHASCWKKASMPARLHYGTNPRVAPIVCMAETGWVIETHAAVAKRAMKTGGGHGYDPEDPQMAALFVANGPAFRAGVVLPGFDNVDVYPLLARLIGVQPRPNDGDLDPLRPALAAR